MRPEDAARKEIDRMLEEAGWAVQDREELNLSAAQGVAVRYFPLEGGQEADYVLFVDREAVGVIEAKPEGTTLTGSIGQFSPDERSGNARQTGGRFQRPNDQRAAPQRQGIERDQKRGRPDCRIPESPGVEPAVRGELTRFPQKRGEIPTH